MYYTELFRQVLVAISVSLLVACNGGSNGGGVGGVGGGGGGGGMPPAPAITTQPVDQSVTAGVTATFSVAASNATGYQWQRSTDGGANFADISGATAASYTTPITVMADNNQVFHVIVSGAGGMVTSNAAMLTVTASTVSTVVFQGVHYGYSGGLYGEISNLAAIREDGTGLTPLTTGTDSKKFAALTPFRKIIYQCTSLSNPQENGLYSVNADGSANTPLVTNDSSATYVGQSESSRIIYRKFTNGNSYDLYSVRADGTGNTPIAATVNEEVFKATAPGDRIIYTQNGDLRSVTADGSGDVPLNASNAPASVLFRSIDGSGRVVFESWDGWGMGGVYRISPDGANLQDLALNTFAYEYQFAGITRNGRVLVYGSTPSAYGVVVNRLIDENGSVLFQLTNEQLGVVGLSYFGSTSSGQIIFGTTDLASGSWDLYAANGASGLPLAAEAGVSEVFKYVTDGGRVVYSTTAGLYAVGTDGSSRSTLALNNNSNPTFKAVLGNRVIYESSESGAIYLYAVNLDGTGTIPLINSGASVNFVAFTPSGKVLFGRNSGSNDLWVVNADGANPLPLANSSEEELYQASFE